jgi:autotransporter-associated beta strand protein
VINGGQLMLAGAGAISTNSAVQIAAGASVHLTGYFASNNINRTIGGLTGAGILYGDGGTVTVNKTSGSDTFSGDIQGGQGLIKSGAGTLALSGANSYAGGTLVSGGALQIGDGSTTGSVVGNITNNASLIYNRSDAITNSSVISGSGALTKNNTNTLVLAGANTYSGTTTVNAGSLTVTSANGLGSTAGGTIVASGARVLLATNTGNFTVGNEALTISGPGVVSGGALRNITGSNTWQGKITLAADAGIGAANGTSLTLDVASGNAIEANNFTFTSENAGTITIADAISLGTGGLTKIGSGNTILSASNNYSGTTFLNLGTLTLSGNGTLGSTSSAVLMSNTTGTLVLDLGGLTRTNASFSINRGVITNGTLVAATYELNGGTNAASLGAGTVNANSGTTAVNGTLGAGTVNVAGGTLTLGSAGRLATNAAVTVNSGQITLGGNETIGSLAGSGGTVALGANTLTAGGNNTSTTFGGAVTGSGVLNKSGNGTLTLSASNSYSGGTLISGGTLDLNGGSVSGNITNNANLTIRADLVNVVSGVGSLTKEGAGIAALWNPNTYTGATVINGGQLMLAGSGALSTNSAVQIASGASLRLDGYFAPADINRTIGGLTGAGVLYSGGGTVTVNKTSGSDTFSGDIQGGQGLIKSGAGTLVLSGNNSFSGALAVNAGVLDLNASTGAAAASASTILVATNATLLVSKTDQVNNSAAVTLSGGTIQRASGVSEVFGSLNMTASSFLDFSGGTAGTITFSGITYTPSALLALDIANFNQGSVLVFQTTNNLSMTGFTFSGSGGFGSSSFNGSTFTITAIPEPSTYLAAAGLLALFALSCRRRAGSV